MGRGQFQGTIRWTRTQVRGQRSSEGNSCLLWATDVNTVIDTINMLIGVSERVSYSVLFYTKNHHQGVLINNQWDFKQQQQEARKKPPFRTISECRIKKETENVRVKPQLNWVRCWRSKVSRERRLHSAIWILPTFTHLFAHWKRENSNFSTWDKQDITEFSLVNDKKAN